MFTVSTWSQISASILVVSAVAVYVVSLLFRSDLSQIFAAVALASVSLYFLVILVLVIASICVIIVRRLASRGTKVDSNVKTRLLRIGTNLRVRMGVNEDIKFVVGKNFSSAYLRRSKLVCGDKLLMDASDEEIEGVVGHELAHLLLKHGRKMTTLREAVIVIAFAFLVSIAFPQAFVLLGTFLASSMLFAVPLSWRLEYRADHEASKRLGLETMIKSLESLRGKVFEGMSTTHPSLTKRISTLKQLNVENQR